MSQLFKSEEARSQVRGWHDRFKARLTGHPTSRVVQTRFGATHVLSLGPEGAPDVVALHGALASSAHLLVELEPLTAHFRVHAVDVIGQSAMSEDRPLPVDAATPGHWLSEVITALGLTRPAVLGVSWGGYVAHRLAAVAPAQLSHLALLVPAGLVTGNPWTGLVKMGWPLTRYLLSPSPAALQRLGENLLTTLDDDWLPYLGDAFRSYEVRRLKVPPLAQPGDFAALEAPVLLIGAEHDVSFPGKALVARAPRLFARVETELLAGAKHSPPTTPAFRGWLAERLTRFFTS